MKNKEQINIRNGHCTYFEGQTGLCNAKEFTRCNPINCKLYTMDELSTIVELQQKLQAKEQECEKLKQRLEYYIEKTTQLLDDIDNKDRFNTELQEECEELKFTLKHTGLLDFMNENVKLRKALDEIEELNLKLKLELAELKQKTDVVITENVDLKRKFEDLKTEYLQSNKHYAARIDSLRESNSTSEERYEKILELIEDRVQDLDNYSENNVIIMNDIIDICQHWEEYKC